MPDLRMRARRVLGLRPRRIAAPLFPSMLKGLAATNHLTEVVLKSDLLLQAKAFFLDQDFW
jgi:hypothetical protein